MIPMVPVHRPQHPGYDVIYSAALEREYIRAQQKPAPAHKPVPELKRASYQRIRAVLEQARGKGWTVAELSVATGLPGSTVLPAVRALQRERIVNVEKVQLRALGRGAGTVEQLLIWMQG